MWVRFPPGTLIEQDEWLTLRYEADICLSENGSENKSADFLIRSLLSANVSERGILLAARWPNRVARLVQNLLCRFSVLSPAATAATPWRRCGKIS